MSSGDKKHDGNESNTDDGQNPGPSRRAVLASAVALTGTAAVPALSGDASAAAAVDGGATLYDGRSLVKDGYDYAPSVMYGDGSTIKMWWCGGGDGGDAVYYAEQTSSGWTSPQQVLTATDTGPQPWKPDSAWDSAHACDPSVVKGNFTADGESWDYAMYYGGTDDSGGANTHIGVAFSNDRTSWHKYSGNPIVHPSEDPTDGYGAGMPTAYRHAGTDDTVTLAFYDSTDSPNNHYVTADDAVSFGSRTDLTANPEPGAAIGDIAFFPDESIWYVCTKHNNDEVCYLYKTATSDLNSTWEECGRINVELTGNGANHNPGWLRQPNGHLYEEGTSRYKYVYFGTGQPRPDFDTWDIGQVRYVDGWEFDDDGNQEGWTSNNVSGDADEPTGGSWTAIADQSDPHWVSPALGINADASSTISIRMANDNDDSNGRIYFERSGDSGFSQTRSVGFDVDTTGDWVTYDVDMSTNDYWTGTVERLRIDPIGDGTGDSLSIGFVRIDG